MVDAVDVQDLATSGRARAVEQADCRFTDYLHIGIPLAPLYFAVAVTLIPRMWPF